MARDPERGIPIMRQSRTVGVLAALAVAAAACAPSTSPATTMSPVVGGMQIHQVMVQQERKTVAAYSKVVEEDSAPANCSVQENETLNVQQAVTNQLDIILHVRYEPIHFPQPAGSCPLPTAQSASWLSMPWSVVNAYDVGQAIYLGVGKTDEQTLFHYVKADADFYGTWASGRYFAPQGYFGYPPRCTLPTDAHLKRLATTGPPDHQDLFSVLMLAAPPDGKTSQKGECSVGTVLVTTTAAYARFPTSV